MKIEKNKKWVYDLEQPLEFDEVMSFWHSIHTPTKSINFFHIVVAIATHAAPF